MACKRNAIIKSHRINSKSAYCSSIASKKKLVAKNKQTWKNSRQSVVNSKWSNVRYKDALLNTGISLPENDWQGSGIPVKWASDSSYKRPKKGIILTYSFIHKKSKFNYEDDRGKIRPRADFSAQQQKDIGKIFNLISKYVNVKFIKVRDQETVGTIRIGFNAITDEQGNWLPYIYATADTPKPDTRGGDIWFNKNFTRDDFRLGLVEGQPVTPSLVMLHEIMHTLGLEHPYDNPKRPTPVWARNMEHTLLADQHLDNQGFMRGGKSYGVSSTPMMWDIAGLQHLYGVNEETNKGKTIHRFSSKQPFFKTVWDSSGNDTFDFSNFGKNLKIDLRQGKLSKISFDVEDDRWSNKKLGSLGIAYGSVIENCTGGDANDVITGNSAANKIKGKDGNDRIFGKDGNDLIVGGDGNDTISGGLGFDTALFSSRNNTIKLTTTKSQNTGDGKDRLISIENVNGGGGNDKITGNKSKNTLNGEKGNDWLYGGGGNDLINGHTGSDLIDGGSGTDTAQFSSRNNTIKLTTTKSQNTGDGEDRLISIENVNGGGGNDKIVGNNSKNTFNGEAGNDRLYGRGGNDLINGHSGSDLIDGGSGSDTVQFSSRNNTIKLTTARSQNTGDGRDRLISIENVNGGVGNDKITGHKGKNTLNGEKGNDRLYGGGGNDLLIGGVGKDQVWGQGGRDTFRIQSGIGYTIIKDFRNGQDKIHLGSGRSGLKLKTRGDDVLVSLKKDLMAIVDDAAGDLQRRGNYLV